MCNKALFLALFLSQGLFLQSLLAEPKKGLPDYALGKCLHRLEAAAAQTDVPHRAMGYMPEIQPNEVRGGQGIVRRVLSEDGSHYEAEKRSIDGPSQAIRREAKVLEKLNSANPPPCIPKFLGMTRDDELGTSFRMEWIKGQTVYERFFVDQNLNATNFKAHVGDFISQMRQLYDGLKWIHSQGILHLDTLPKNLMITPEGALKIVDFGIAVGEEPHTSLGYARPSGFNGSGSAPEVKDAFNWKKVKLSPSSDFYTIGYMMSKWYGTLKGKISDPPLSIEMTQLLRRMNSIGEHASQDHVENRASAEVLDQDLRELELELSRMP